MILVGSTLTTYAMAEEGTWGSWLMTAEGLREHSPEPIEFFAAIETDGRGLEPFKPLIDRLTELRGSWWTFHLDDGRRSIHTETRLAHIVTGQNLVSMRASDTGASHLLFMAADCRPPADAIPKLLELDWSLVGGEVSTYCVDDATEALTRDGWKHRWELQPDDELLSLEPESDTIVWSRLQRLSVFDYDGLMTRFKTRRLDALTTDEHRWLVRVAGGQRGRTRPGFLTTTELAAPRQRSRTLILGGGTPMEFADTPVFSDEFVELLGWVVTEGHYMKRGHSVDIAQSESGNPGHVEKIRRLAKHFADQGATVTEALCTKDTHCSHFYFGKGIGLLIRQAAPRKQLSPALLCSLTLSQGRLLYDTLLNGDGSHATSGQIVWSQKDRGRLDMFQMLCAMLGLRSHLRPHAQTETCSLVGVYHGKGSISSRVGRLTQTKEWYVGKVWCPTIPTGVFMARRNGYTFWTGNCLHGDPVKGYPFPVEEHMPTAAFILIRRDAFKVIRWRTDGERGMSDDPCYYDDVWRFFGVRGRVRKDVIGQHWPPAIGPIERRYPNRDMSVR